jgi:hypothetical protein
MLLEYAQGGESFGDTGNTVRAVTVDFYRTWA